MLSAFLRGAMGQGKDKEQETVADRLANMAQMVKLFKVPFSTCAGRTQR
jgi:hypothetical protein